MSARRLLFLGHRWLGILLCLFMALWFVSGVVMMYVGYPKLTQAEKLAAASPLPAGGCCIAGDALRDIVAAGGLRSLRLFVAGGEPRYIVASGRRELRVFSAVSGRPVPPVSAESAILAAAAFAPGVSASAVERIDEDAWTHSRALDPHRPLWRIALNDPSLAYLYVSGKSGEVVRDVTVTENLWNWVGAWLHWLYPLRGGWVDRWWTEIVIYSSLLATVLAMTGMVIGVLRWRRRPYRSGSRSPYRMPMLRWHHWGGLLFGVLAVTWVASGLFSMNPWRIFDTPGQHRPPLRLAAMTDPGEEAKRALSCFAARGFVARELEWYVLNGDNYVEGRSASGGLMVQRTGSACDPLDRLDATTVEQAARQLMPHARMESARVQTEHDWHYYSRAAHSMTGHIDKPLPVLVVRFDDPQATALYMDLRNGRLLQRLDTRRRVKRWLFAFFHSWDWLPLLESRPVWDVLLIAGSVGGLLISFTGIVIGWRRLVR